MQLTVLVPSFNRLDILEETLRRLSLYLSFAGDWSVLVSDDGDETERCADLVEAMGAKYIPGPRKGLGANLNNLLLNAPKESFLLQMDDDHWLNKEVDLTPHAEWMNAEPNCGWLRLMFGGYAGKPIDPKTYYHFKGDSWGRYWKINWHSPEAYLTSNRPHLKKLDFHKYFGFYQEGVKLGETEYEFCMRCKDIAMHTNSPYNVYIPMYPPPEEAWLHASELGIGKSELSWQVQGY